MVGTFGFAGHRYIGVLGIVRRNRRGEDMPVTLNADQQQQLKKLLEEDKTSTEEPQ